MKYKIKFILSALLFAVSVSAASAQSVFLNSPKVNYRVGDSFRVSLGINTGGKSINTISGKVVVPTDKFQITDLRYGNSILTLWVEKPAINYGTGIISFSGGLPGGYGGSNGPILSFTAKAKQIGSATIGLKEVQVLLNDGLGTELTGLTLSQLNLNLKEALPPPPAPTPVPKKEEEKLIEVQVLPPDKVPPENFFPLVSRHPSVADNQSFVSFSAVDKDSGIDYYEVREEPLILNWFTDRFSTAWVKTESPYVLKHQLWINRILIRAYDRAGNATDGETAKPIHPYLLISLIVVLVALTALITRRISLGKRSADHKKARNVII